MAQLLLVRHGQASFGAADYDVLSPVGERQAAVTGAALAAVRPTLVVHGQMQRQRRTAELMIEAAGWDVVPTVDPGWDEFDHLAVLAALPHEYDGEPDRRQFQAWYEKATERWRAGEHDDDYAESWPSFCDRVMSAFGSLDDSTAVVVTSGGPISLVVAHLLGAPAAFERLNPVVVNAAVTKIVVGSRGRTLVSFNEHAHLTGDLLTYR